MRLGLAMLDNVSTLNNLKYLNQVQILPGETTVVRFQLIDVDTKSQTNQIGNRYIPANTPVAPTMQITIQSVDDSKTITKAATMSFPNDDRSIWEFPLSNLETQNAAGVNLSIVLTENTSVKMALGKNVLSMSPSNIYQC